MNVDFDDRLIGGPRPAYVVGLCFTPSRSMGLWVRKNRPRWQEGMLNGVGGKIEDGETPLQAMKREWAEEVPQEGISEVQWTEVLTLQENVADITFFVSSLPSRLLWTLHNKSNDVGERLEVHSLRMNEQDFIPNLRWIAPLAAHGYEPMYEPFTIKAKNR